MPRGEILDQYTVKVNYWADFFLLGEPPQEEFCALVYRRKTIVEWWSSHKFWRIVVRGVNSPESLIRRIKRGMEIIYNKTRSPLILKEGGREAQLVINWDISVDYWDPNLSNALYTKLNEVWGEYYVKDRMVAWKGYYIPPALLSSKRLTSSFVGGVISFVNSFYNRLHRLPFWGRRLREIRGKLESLPIQDPLYVDPEWYK